MSKSPSLRRIQADVRELAIDPSDRYHAAPLEDDMFEWHFTIRGAEGTDFEGGVYHGRILLPPEYPFKPPHIVFLTPSGRFETNTKVCLSFSAFHPELWQPAWGIRLILEALISFLPTKADGAIGALDWTPVERKRLAKKSVTYCCPRCGNAAALLPEPKSGEESSSTSKPRFAKEIEQLRLLQAENQNKQDKKEELHHEEPTPLVEETPTEPAPAPTPPVAATNSDRGATTEVVEEETEEEIPAVPEVPQQQQQAQPAPAAPSIDLSWLNDNVLHAIIIVLAALCYVLYHKAVALYEEIQSLNELSR